MGKLGDDFVRIIRDLGENDFIDNNRLGDFSRRLNAVDRAENLVRGWSQPGGSDPFFRYLRAFEGEFKRLPLYVARIGNNDNQTITTATTTELKPAASSSPNPIGWGMEYNLTNGSITQPSVDGNQAFLYMGHVSWDAVSADTDVILDIYNDVDNSFIFRLDARHILNGKNELVFGANINAGFAQAARDLQLRVWHNQGSDLDVDLWRLTVVRIR